ncbi:hypothetical protein DPMN_139964 [Dreissena polymorpha]|uniref:Uncharacterized protein n=1 Tax=Dreissena polymorpha TaxID=45954 RepID=A0A9D4G6Q2_DREPO|nr:hypothetical protein DPMN_139964 [Dreissena polymorpha]
MLRYTVALPDFTGVQAGHYRGYAGTLPAFTGALPAFTGALPVRVDRDSAGLLTGFNRGGIGK